MTRNGPFRILLTHPFCWPYVRRGSERFLNELAQYLASRGHDVTVLSSKPGPEEVKHEGQVLFVRKRQLRNPLLKLVGFPAENAFLFTCQKFLSQNEFDIIHCLYPSDGSAAHLSGKKTGIPHIFHMTGIPVRQIIRRRPWDYLMLKLSMTSAAKVVVVSQAAEEALERDFGLAGERIPVPCDLHQFQLHVEKRDVTHPKILSVASFRESRKGARVLIKAFALLKRRIPGAILQYSGEMPENTQRELLATVDPSIWPDVHFLGVGELSDLPGLYAGAALTVLPSVGDSFGMVLVESLACGTPVVGSRNGGIPDIIQDGIGTMFDPGPDKWEPGNPEGLTEALLAALCLHEKTASLAILCRRRAEFFSWERLGPRFEELYLAAIHNEAPH